MTMLSRVIDFGTIWSIVRFIHEIIIRSSVKLIDVIMKYM